MASAKNESTLASVVNTSSMTATNSIEISTKIGIISAYSVVFILALSGNILIIHIVVRKSYMRSTINFLIANMAAADLLMTLFAMPYSVFFLYFGNQWIGGAIGNVTCKLVHFTIGLSIAASISTLIVISLDRFFAIVYPFRRSAVIKRIPITITTTWVTSALLLSPYLFIYKVQSTKKSVCVLSIFDNSLESLGIYHVIFFVVLYVIPLVIIASFYAAVCRKLWIRKIPGNPSAVNLRSANKAKKRTVKMLVIVVVVFALCWLPAHVMHLIVFFDNELYQKLPKFVFLASFFISHANSAINPFLYVRLNKNFKRAFLDIVEKFQNWKRRGPRTSRSLTNTSLTQFSTIGHENVMSLRYSPTGKVDKECTSGSCVTKL